jgi:hypothetical protein
LVARQFSWTESIPIEQWHLRKFPWFVWLSLFKQSVSTARQWQCEVIV